MAVLYTNNAKTTLSAGITNVATSIPLVSGASFPAPTNPDYFYATLTNAAESVFEIVKVTANSANTLTVVRAQDGTTAVAWNAGDKVELRITKAVLDDFKTDTRNGTATAAAKLASTNWTIQEVAGVLYFQYGGVNKAKLDSTGNITALGDVLAYTTV